MSAKAMERLRFARALRSRSFALLWTGQAVSALGDGAFYTAMAWQVLVLTHSGTAMGLVGIAEMLPRVLFLLAGGVAADRLPRRLLMIWSDGGGPSPRSPSRRLAGKVCWPYGISLCFPPSSGWRMASLPLPTRRFLRNW